MGLVGWADPPGHVTCDACWEANPHPRGQTPVKTLPCPKLHLRVVKMAKIGPRICLKVPYVQI